MHLTLDRVAEVVEVFSGCEENVLKKSNVQMANRDHSNRS